MKTNKQFADKEFKLTADTGNFDGVRTMCQNMGGELVTNNLGPEGSHYHA